MSQQEEQDSLLRQSSRHSAWPKATGCRMESKIQRVHSHGQDLVERATLVAEMLSLRRCQSIHPESQDRAARGFLVHPMISMLHQHQKLIKLRHKPEVWEKEKDG